MKGRILMGQPIARYPAKRLGDEFSKSAIFEAPEAASVLARRVLPMSYNRCEYSV